jgi:hypothetical protein
VDKLLVVVKYFSNMSKFLQKKLKRSLPVIVIFCLINVLVLGFSFNLNLNFVKPEQKGFVKMAPAAEAASTAITYVTVKNAPPVFSAGPSENPVSTSTTPINVGGNISFTGTATDFEGDSYRLLICGGNKATSTNDSQPPTCTNGTRFCYSSLASSSVQVNCTYSSITDPGSETQVWYAFVCDNHQGNTQCSPYSQGTGNDGSPFYVNHAPRLNTIYTSVDNIDPGAPATITVTASDYDHASGVYNIQNFYVCSTNSWSAAAGCGGTELCHSSSTVPGTASSTASCQYTIPIPKNHTAYPYYGFIKDQFKMPASAGNGTTNNYNVNNVTPVVSNVTLNGNTNITLNIKGAPDKIVKATSTSVTDNNGCTDLSTATSTIFLNTVAGGNNCAANNSNCYQIPTASCTISNCAGPTSVSATVVCSTTLAFFTMPTDASAPASTTNSWFADIRVADIPGLKGSGSFNSLNTVDVVSSAALSVNEASIDYGQIQAGTDTGTTNSATTIVNYGNTPIDTSVYGSDMAQTAPVGASIIKIGNQKHNKNTFTYGTGGTVTGSSTPDTVTVGIPRPINLTDVTAPIYWGIKVPFGTPSATFTGQNTFTVVLNKYDTWNYP